MLFIIFYILKIFDICLFLCTYKGKVCEVNFFFKTSVFGQFSFQILPPATNIKEAYANGQDEEQKFIQNLSLFLCTILKEHGELITKRPQLNDTFLTVSDEFFKFLFGKYLVIIFTIVVFVIFVLEIQSDVQ